MRANRAVRSPSPSGASIGHGVLAATEGDAGAGAPGDVATRPNAERRGERTARRVRRWSSLGVAVGSLAVGLPLTIPGIVGGMT